VRAVAQRVSSASVVSDGETLGEIEHGLLVYLGVGRDDAEADATWLAEKIASLRIFEDAYGKMNLSLLDQGGGLLVVSQFTLLADARKGRRPSYSDAAAPDVAERLYEFFITKCRSLTPRVSSGKFQATMRVSSVNEGPVTILLDSKKSF
jgi:D-tyrosyl-tRNA(Tyr) deacylase